MNISNLFVQILTPLLYFTASQQSDAVNMPQARIGEKSWDFPPNSNVTLKVDNTIPYNATLEGYRGYKVGCNKFINKSTNETITPKFSFNYPNDTMPVHVQDCTTNIQPGCILTECPQLSFRHTHNVEACIKNESDVHVLGIDCDAGV